MDATPQSYATRCLPLNIANAHGWELLCPTGFEAVWRGSREVGSVVITPDPNTPETFAPVSIFGVGVMTFHVYGIFRTPPGWNLLVGPTPNRFIDGISGLTGIIETDWAPFTFTMNWKFTRPNHPVRFNAGDPFCFFYPVQRGALERFEPRFAPLNADSDTARQFAAWSKSRDAFQVEIKTRHVTNPSEGWQKTYYRGVDMDGKKFTDHETRLHLKEFR